MSITFKTGPGALTMKGMDPSKGFSAEFVPTPYSYPAVQYPEPLKDGLLNFSRGAYQTTTEPTLVLSGNLKGFELQLLPWGDTPDPPTFRLLPDYHFQRLGVVATSVRAHVEVRTEYGAKRFRYDFTSAAPGEPQESNVTEVGAPEYEEGSLARECLDNCMAIFAGSPAGKPYNSQFLDGGVYSVDGTVVQDNPSFVGAEVDLTGVSIARSGNTSPWLPYTLVTPRHAIFGSHIDNEVVGDQVLFRRANGITQVVSILAVQRYPLVPVNGNDSETDLAVVYLSAPVTGCKAYKVLPSDWERYLPSQDPRRPELAAAQLPAVTRAFNTGYENSAAPEGNLFINNDCPKLIVQAVEWLGNDASLGMTSMSILGRMKWPELLPHFRGVYPGDSSSPTFLLVREQEGGPLEPVFLSALYAVTSIFGITSNAIAPLVSARIAWINQKMNEMAVANGDNTPYALQVVDLSRFNTYTPYGEV